jgi:hypothetical protein
MLSGKPISGDVSHLAKTRLDAKFPARIRAAHLGFVVECKTRLDNQSLSLLFIIIVISRNAAVEVRWGQ